MITPPQTRSRQDNWATETIYGDFTDPHRRLLDKLETMQFSVDFIKINGSCYTGKQNKAGTSVSFLKFMLNFRQALNKVVSTCPAATDAAANIEYIFHELRPGEEAPEFITVFNQLVYKLLLSACDEEALNIVLTYKYADDNPQIEKQDGRRALFALMQTYEPVSTNASNNAKAKFDNFRYKADKDTIQDQITEFYVLVQKLEATRNSRLQPLELWTFATSAIKGAVWAPFRLTISMQPEYKKQRSHWLIDQVREFVLSIEDERDTSPSPTSADGRKKSILNAAKGASSDYSATAELTATVNKLAATVAAITTNKEMAPRAKGKPTFDNRAWDAKMGPCRFCGGGHRHRDCGNLKTSEPKPPIPPRAGAVRGAPDSDDTPGFLMGAIATDQPAWADNEDHSCTTSSAGYFVSFMAMLTAIFWFVIAYIVVASRGHITVQNNHRVAVCHSDRGVLANVNDTYCGFGVDTCASHHICDDQSKFSSIDFRRTKTFEVVHGSSVTSKGVGNVTLMVATTSGITKEVTLTDVHYIPQQRMSLISVGCAMQSQGFGSPDLEKLTWKVDRNCTLKLLKTNGTFQLDASVKYWKWTASGIKVERSGAQH